MEISTEKSLILFKIIDFIIKLIRNYQNLFCILIKYYIDFLYILKLLKYGKENFDNFRFSCPGKLNVSW
jgi:hypothetical protein